MPVPTLRNGKPGILFPDEVISSLAEPFKFALVGKISGNRSPNSGISAAFAKLGLVRYFDLKFMPWGFLVLTLAFEEDYAFFWTKGVMQVGPLSVRFSKWTPEFNLQEESPIAPVWIRFPGLPLHLFSKQSLFALAKIVGKPVKMDDHTADSTRGAFARVCVEINVLEPLVKEVWDAEPDPVGLYCVDTDPPCGNLEDAGVGTSGKDQLESVLVEGVILSDEVIDGGLQLDDCVDGTGVPSTSELPVFGSLGPCTLNHSSHSIPYVPLSPDDASSAVEELVARQVPSVSELVFRLESAGDTDQEFDRYSESGDGCRSESRILDADMGDIKKRKENAFHRGLRSSESQQRLRAHVKEKRVKILAILEPMIDLDVFFAEDVMVECLFDHTQFLHFRVSASFLPTTVFCSFVYAKCDYIERRQLWTSLLQVKPDQGPWLVGGDFNVVRNSSECLGSSGGRLLPMEEFNHFILDSGLVDASFEGSSFTWTNKTIWKRLDRVFVSVDWGDHFHSIRVEHLIRTVSDHCPLFVSVPAVRVAEAVCEADPSDLHWTSLSNCNEDLARVTAMEADFWRQKAACMWLEDSERNTKLFHNMVKKKRVANKIFRIWDNGSCLTSLDLIQQSGAAFFQNLLTGDPFVLSCPDFSDFPLHCWEIVHQDILDAVLDFFRGSPMPQGFTATTITLIPKVMGAQAWSDFRPISLCNVTNKIISKLLYSRLKVVAERLVSWNQSGFVPGRVISDIILLAQELTHSLSLPTRGGNVILKLDMAKAYDRSNEQVVSLISACISHCQFSVNINGSLTGFFGSTRGLRQGDPLSPLLFILGAEYLSRGLDRLYHQYPAIRYRSGCDLPLSHLSYVDDIIIFANGGTREMNSLMDSFHHYENCLGQLVNAFKSVIILPPRCSGRTCARLFRITGW
ncbi:uncharacterized protein [Primulina eburnea]|uniref:uncharacterized protein n=1 Tax=Primulina eburnea TaxID=1245227 RepID=UPI003C6C082D